MAERLLAGDRSTLARAITLVESRAPKWQDVGQGLVSAAIKAQQDGGGPSGGALRIGLSGPPGAGKSTFVEALGNLLTAAGEKVAVLSVDPSSTLTGGSILGDKTRMTHLSRHPNAYVRPSPSSGSLGGVARNTCDSILLCEAAGFSTVLVETVGVGQSEVAVADMVDMFVLVVPPGGGDELQGIKRGIVELVDLVIVNKADGDLIPAARRAHFEYLSALKLMRQRSPDWRPRVESVSSLEMTGIDKAWERMAAFREATMASGSFQEKRRNQSNVWLWHHVTDRLLSWFKAHPTVDSQVSSIEADVLSGKMTAGQGADELIRSFAVQNTSSTGSQDKQ